MTLKILLISEYFPPKIFGGGEISAWLLAKNLAKEPDIEISVLTSHFSGLKKFEEKEEVKIYRRLKTGENPTAPRENLKRKFLFPCSLKKELRKIAPNYDVIHFLNTTSITPIKTKAKKVATINSYGNFCPKSNLFYKEKEICSGCKFTKFVPCLLNSEYIGKVKLKGYLKYNPLFWLLSYWNYKKRKEALHSLDKFIAISEFTQEQLLKEGLSEEKIEKIPNLAAIKEEGGEYPLEERGTVITYIGVLEKIKGVSLLINAFNEIKNESGGLIIVGDGSERENLEKLSGERIKFLGKVEYNFMPSIYKKTDIIVLPSLWPEPLSRVLLEALYFGKPIIATKAGGNAECIIEGENGFLVKPERGEIRERLTQLLRDKRMREEMGNRSNRLYERKFKKENLIKRMVNFYERIT